MTHLRPAPSSFCRPFSTPLPRLFPLFHQRHFPGAATPFRALQRTPEQTAPSPTTSTPAQPRGPLLHLPAQPLDLHGGLPAQAARPPLRSTLPAFPPRQQQRAVAHTHSPTSSYPVLLPPLLSGRAASARHAPPLSSLLCPPACSLPLPCTFAGGAALFAVRPAAPRNPQKETYISTHQRPSVGNQSAIDALRSPPFPFCRSLPSPHPPTRHPLHAPPPTPCPPFLSLPHSAAGPVCKRPLTVSGGGGSGSKGRRSRGKESG